MVVLKLMLIHFCVCFPLSLHLVSMETFLRIPGKSAADESWFTGPCERRHEGIDEVSGNVTSEKCNGQIIVQVH